LEASLQDPRRPVLSLKRRRALESLRKLRLGIEKDGLPSQPNLYHVAALTVGLIAILRAAHRNRASAAANYLFRMAPASFRASGVEAQLACKRGCAFCCHGYVSATAPQIFAAAAAVREQGLAFETARERIRVTAMRVQGLAWRDRIALRLPCPLLVDAACSIYAARPLACRGYVSPSVAACERAFERLTEEVTIPPAYANVRSALEMALRAALKACELPNASYELTGALMRALDCADAETRWLAGEEVFAASLVDRSADAATESQRAMMIETLLALARGEQPAQLSARAAPDAEPAAPC
jgi:hypothetical protein